MKQFLECIGEVDEQGLAFIYGTLHQSCGPGGLDGVIVPEVPRKDVGIQRLHVRSARFLAAIFRSLGLKGFIPFRFRRPWSSERGMFAGQSVTVFP